MSMLDSRYEFGSASTDREVGENVIGGPLSGKDVRMYLDQPTLARLLEIANQSITGRVHMDGVGLRVKAYRNKGGHVYEVWSIISAPPKPEQSQLLTSLTSKK